MQIEEIEEKPIEEIIEPVVKEIKEQPKQQIVVEQPVQEEIKVDVKKVVREECVIPSQYNSFQDYVEDRYKTYTNLLRIKYNIDWYELERAIQNKGYATAMEEYFPNGVDSSILKNIPKIHNEGAIFSDCAE